MLSGDINRDGENLPQINMCMLMGQASRLPVYHTVYSGSLKDVSTLRTTLAKFDSVTDGRPVLAVMDKGFFSRKNVTAMLGDEKDKEIYNLRSVHILLRKTAGNQRAQGY